MAKILIIDDDPTIHLTLKKPLEDSGYDVAIANNGLEGIKAAKTLHPDLIICDWIMPIVDGLEVCQQIKADPELSLTYFILVTMRCAVDDRVKALDIGADDYLSKPIDINELQARVRSGLRLQRLSQELQQANQELLSRNQLLQSLSLTDQLTGLLNRRAMDETLPKIVEQVGYRDADTRYRYLCLLIIDVDFFKKVNDTYGHAVGDIVLQSLAGRIKTHARSGSMVYRYGGEELVCITPGLHPKMCVEYGESLRMAIAKDPIAVTNGLLIPITISIGCAIASQTNLVSAENLLKQADLALYQAKTDGRNCLRVCQNSIE